MSPGSCPPVHLPGHCWCQDLPPGTSSGGLCWVCQRILHRSKVHSPMREEGPTGMQHSQDPQDRSIQPSWPQAAASLLEQELATPVPLSGPFRLPENKQRQILLRRSRPHAVPTQKTQHLNLPQPPLPYEDRTQAYPSGPFSAGTLGFTKISLRYRVPRPHRAPFST